MEGAENRDLAEMVADLRRNGYAQSSEIRAAFAQVPRQVFLPDVPPVDAYQAFRSVATHFNADGTPVSASSAPAKMATMLDLLDVRPGHHVLEVGTGTGYNAALLARLAGPEGHVTTVDIDPGITIPAEAHLLEAGLSDVEVFTNDGWVGVPERVFDRIEATVEVWDISSHWVAQLREGGILVTPLWVRPGLEVTVAFEKVGEQLVSRALDYGGFMPLRGPNAGPERFAVVPGWADRFSGATDEIEWTASLDDANDVRVAMLHNLLRGAVRTQAAPKLPAGWNIRLSIEVAGPVSFTGRRDLWHMTAGLLDAGNTGLAIVDGGRLVGFGDHRLLETLTSFLAHAEPFDFAALAIKALPHDAGAPSAPTLLARPSYDLLITYEGDPIHH